MQDHHSTAQLGSYPETDAIRAALLARPSKTVRFPAKVAWLALFLRAGNRLQTVPPFSYAELATLCGGTERQARVWLPALANAGMIDFSVDRGTVAAYLLDPRDQTPRRIDPDPQRELAFADSAPTAPKSPADSVPKPPAIFSPTVATAPVKSSTEWSEAPSEAAAVSVPKPPETSVRSCSLLNKEQEQELLNKSPQGQGPPIDSAVLVPKPPAAGDDSNAARERWRMPWHSEHGIDDSDLKRIVADEDVARLEQLYDEAVSQRWFSKSEDNRLRLYTIVHHVGTSKGFTKPGGRKGSLVNRTKRNLSVDKIRQKSEEWAARIIRESYL